MDGCLECLYKLQIVCAEVSVPDVHGQDEGLEPGDRKAGNTDGHCFS